ncbi:Myosin heavy chain-related protein [Rhynchospora pubera]|uniref:Myosin heavy chain-related protein n=1 Tax=Rhynchospora pubera TaxID=906938 RepID=A0AAV8E9L1_9POAL|nr:Myosin heavy chain-related protein [Rhynchospora pubera]
MFKLHRHRSDRLVERIEFKFSNFQAAQVPKGWDKIFISVICLDNGKSVAKSSRAVVRNGTCHWPDSMSEFISFYQDVSTKEIEECHYKFVVLMGSSRTTILGEITLNLADYLSSSDPSVISSPLNKCNFTTTLQFNIQCLSTKSKLRGAKSAKDGSSHHEDRNTGNDSKSDGSATPDELGTKEASLSASESHCSSNSGEISIDRTTFSPHNTNSSYGGSYVGRQDSNGSFVNSPFSKSNGISQLASPLGSTKDLLEAAEETIEELRDEAKMWERHSRKVKVEMENLKKDYAEKAKQLDEVQTELSSANAERDFLKLEVEQLKTSLEESRASAIKSFGTPKYDDMVSPKYDEMMNSHKELEGELQFQKETNANLTLQLRKTQEANVELLAVIQELEEAVEAQREDISRISTVEQQIKEKDEEIAVLKNKLAQAVDRPSRPGANPDMSQQSSDLERENEALKAKIHELERDCAELTDENLDLLYKIKDLNNGDIAEVPRRDATEKSQLNDFEIKCAELEIKLQGFREENDKLLKKLQKSEEEMVEKNNELSELRESLALGNSSFSEKLEESKSESTNSLKERIDILMHSNAELGKKNGELEEIIESLHDEKSSNSASLEEVKRDIDSHVASNKVLERKSKELELANKELELQISELEQENIQLSERISGLEAQSRYLKDEQESNRAELEDSRSLIQELKEKLVRQQTETEQAKFEHREKLQQSNEKFEQAQEEVEALRRSNAKVQSTVEGLIEECSSLQSLNVNLRKQKVELHENVTRLELQLEESRKKCVEFSRRAENLEGKLLSLQIDVSSKEQSMLSELERLLEEHKEQEEKISRAHQMLSKLEVEKAVEVENLHNQIEALTAQISSTDDEKERVQLDTVQEVSNLRSDKAKLESSLNAANLQVKTYESDLETLKRESKNKVQGLVDLLGASKQSEAMLMADIEHMRSLVETTRSNEENLNRKSNELEVRLKSSDYEKKQILEEISDLKSQVQKITQLQEEILHLKGLNDETKFEKEKLEEKLKLICDQCEELRREKEALAEKVGSMEKALNTGEDERRSKTVLEAKLVRLQSDLSIKDAASAVEAELRNEINRMKRSNKEYQRRIQSLEQEKEELLRSQCCAKEEENNKPTQEQGDVHRESEGKIVALEAELKEMKERYSNISLQYAQVEAEREELVQKLKSTKTTPKRWFS